MYMYMQVFTYLMFTFVKRDCYKYISQSSWIPHGTPSIDPKRFLFGTAEFSFEPDTAVNYDYIVTNSINSLLNST